MNHLACLLAAVLVFAASLAHAQPASINFDQARAHYEFGQKQLRDNDLKGAVESFTQAIDLQPGFLEAYETRAQAFRRLEKLATTVEERDIAAMGYISDEHHLTLQRSRKVVSKELSEVIGKRSLAIAVIIATVSAILLYLRWLRQRSASEETPLKELPLEVQRRELQALAQLGGIGEYETGLKYCPQCARELSTLTRVCPRCSHRFAV
ncbi:hypothetical protein NA78x_001102 [Anatilimnocola sp. NA78]|uniref:hypothetical protein n=1 Tax=Anatilimnocola sp. NA78 TaxID=3415683 RepID=UPI003CE5BC93